MLTIKGYFIKVTKHSKLKFRYSDSDTVNILVVAAEGVLNDGPCNYSEYIKRHVTGVDDEEDINEIQPHLPFNDSTFTVILPKWIKNPPQDVLSRAGLLCTVEVKMLKYDFTSEAKHNAGERIIGVQLVFNRVLKSDFR